MLDLRLAVDETAYGDGPLKVRCPVHDDPSASLAVYPDNIHCFGCGFHRNNPDEALAVLLGISRTEARSALPQFDSERLDAYRLRAAERAKLDPLPTSKAKMYNTFLRQTMSHRLEWFYARGLTDETIDRALLGHDGARFTIPVFDQHGQLLTIRYRKDLMPDQWDREDNRTRIPKYSGTKGRNGLFLYGAQWLGDTDYVIVTEGELDALRLLQCGHPVCSATNGARQVVRVPRLLSELFPSIRRLYIATDQDDAGHDAARQTARGAEGYEVKRLRWLTEVKDVTEHLMLGDDSWYEESWNGKGFVGIEGPISLDSLRTKHLRHIEPTWTNGSEGLCLQHLGRAA